MACLQAAAAVSVPRFPANSYINVGTPDALQLPSNQPFTIEAWVRAESTPTTAMIYSKNNARTSPYTYMFGLTGGGTKMAAYTGAGGTPANKFQEISLPSKIDIGGWHHLAYVFDGTDIHFYYDGDWQGSLPYSFGNTPAHSVKIGGYANGVDWLGNIADVRVWNQARSARQIAVFRSWRLTGAESGLVGYWPLNEGTGTTAFDTTSNGSDGALMGGSTWATHNLNLSLFAVAQPDTESTWFTNTNVVDVALFHELDGYTHYQITEFEAPPNGNPGAWTSTNSPPASITFTKPTADTNVVLTAWYTNLSTSVALAGAKAEIYYTTVTPTPSARATLARHIAVGYTTVNLFATDLNTGSSGGANNLASTVVNWVA